MNPVPNCPGVANLSIAAGYYANMTSILAGFAFTAIVLLLTPTQISQRGNNSRTHDNGVPLTLMAAFVALLIATYSFSTLAAQAAGEARGRSAAQQLVCGVIFALAVFMLFKGITLLMHTANVDRVALWTVRVTTVVIGPALIMFILVNGAMDTERIRVASIAKTCTVSPSPLGLVLSGALAATLALSLIPRLQPPIARFWAKKIQNVVPIAVLACSITCAVAVNILGAKPPDFLLPPLAITWFFIGVFTLLLLIGLVIALGFPDVPRSNGATPTAVVRRAE